MIFVMTFSLFLLWVTGDSTQVLGEKQTIFYSHQAKVLHHFESRKVARIYNAISTGNKQGISQGIVKRFKKMGLYHLFTPSGIHLSSLLLLFSPLFSAVRRKAFIYSLLIDFTLLGTVCLLPEMHSLKRIALFGFLLRNMRFKSHRLPLFGCFIATFALAALFGSYQASPLSYIYSFLFLGIICSAEGLPKYAIPLGLFAAQLIVSYHQLSPIYWSNIILSPVLTALFSLIFPFLFLGNFISSSWPIMESLLLSFLWLVKTAEQVAIPFGLVSPNELMIGMVLLMVAVKGLRAKGWIICLTLLIHTESLYNLPNSSVKKVSGAKASIDGKIDSIRRTKRGYSVSYTNGKRCYPKLYANGYYETCSG